jgi:hypothetical protein
VRVDGERDRDGDREQQRVEVRELCVVEQGDREHDRREAARAEPAQERQGRSASAGSQHRERDRHHPHDRQAEDGVEHDLPGHLVQQRAEDDRAEDDEGHGVKQLAAFVSDVAHLTTRVASQGAEPEATRERGDEDASARCFRDSGCEQGRGEAQDLHPVWLDQPPGRGELQRDTAERSGDDAAGEPVADLREDELRCGVR